MKQIFLFAFTLVGTFVGAGFATGQEMISFFTLKNPENPLYFVLASAVVFLSLKSVKKVYKGADAGSFYISLFGKTLGTVMFFASLASLFVCFGASAAGMGSLFFESFHLPYISGAGILTAVSVITCIKGIRGINILNAILTPVIIVAVVVLGIFACLNPSYELIAFTPKTEISLIFALLYSGYNIFPLIPVTLSERENNKGLFAGFVLISLLGVILFMALKTHLFLALSSSVPFEAIIRSIYPKIGNLYSIVMCMALVTTGASCLYGFVSDIEKSGKLKKFPLYLISVIAVFFFLFFGFVKTVRIIYPISGIFGIILILRLIIYR